MRIALVQDSLIKAAGSEKTFAVMCEAFPGADVFTSLYFPESTLPCFRSYNVVELVDRRLVSTERALKQAYPVAALQIGRKDFSEYDLILSSAAHLARYIRKGTAKHFSYCYYPFRLLYEPNRYPQDSTLMRIGRDLALPVLRRWDYAKAQQVDRFIAISGSSRDAIRKYYHRDADVIFAPILGLPDAYVPAKKENFFLVVSRLEKWKRIDLVVSAFTRLGERLVIIGDGPERESLQSMAGRNIEFAGTVSEDRLVDYYRSALAVVHVTETEYGLVPIEANAYGTPAICYGAGGVLETMVPYVDGEPGATALFFPELTPESLAAAVRRFHEIRFDPVRLFENAVRFGKRAFIERIVSYVHAHMPDTKAPGASSGLLELKSTVIKQQG